MNTVVSLTRSAVMRYRHARLRAPMSCAQRRCRGLSYFEVLVASSVCVFCLSVMVQLWSFSMSMSVQANDKAVAYNLARQTLEQVIETGFTNTPEATSLSPMVHYFDINLNNMDGSSASARYKVSTTVVSSSLISGSNPATPTTTALRLVTVTVILTTNNSTLYTVNGYLARGGI